MKLCTMGYCPPPAFPGATAFYENIRRFKTTHPLVLFSDHAWPEINIPLKISPEAPFAAGKPHKFCINNILWFTALQLARKSGVTHMLYLESDCRVGCDNWDGKMFDEHFDIGRPLVASGTLAVYNPMNWNGDASRRWQKLVSDNYKRNVPCATYGWEPASKKAPTCIFTNGALAIYNIEWMHELFDLTQPATKHALNPAPFDMDFGVKLWNRFEVDAYEVLGMLGCAYSGYGDLVTTPEERRAMLASGKIVAMHQEKTEWTMP